MPNMTWDVAQRSLVFNLLRAGMRRKGTRPILWAGAGLSIPAGYPSLDKLAEGFRERQLNPLSSTLSGQALLDEYARTHTEGDFEQTLSELLPPRLALDYHVQLVGLPWAAIVTTSYDNLLEDACLRSGTAFVTIIPDRNVNVSTDNVLPIYKPHGDISDYRKVVLTGNSYSVFDSRYKVLKEELEGLWRRHPIVFFGCSMRDPRLLDWLRSMRADQLRQLRTSATILRQSAWESLSEEERSLLASANVHPVFAPDYDQISVLIQNLYSEFGQAPRPRSDFGIPRTNAFYIDREGYGSRISHSRPN